ncbi:MAG TPA: SCO family protein [Rhizomicrobium sp.]|nr:SCO family protein [Rhizomicrobium sp.]
MLRNKQALIPYLLLAAALAGGLLWHESETVPGLGRSVITGQADVGGPFRLTDQNGKAVSDTDFRGRYMLVYFGYSFCPDVCPTTLSVMAQALDRLGGESRRVTPVFITIDPERDTPQVLGDYMKAFGPNFVGLTGSAAAIKDVEKKYRVYAVKKPLDSSKGGGGGYGMDHSSVMYLMGPDGKMISFYDEAISPDDLAKDLRQKI